MQNIKESARGVLAFLAHDWKAFAIVAAILLGFIIWLLNRDGFTPRESRGNIEVRDSNGNLIYSDEMQEQGGQNENFDNQ